MKSARARWRAHRTLGATRRWTTTGYATAQWKARSARRCPPPPGRTLTNRNFFSFCGGPNPCPLDQSSQAKHHHFDPRKQTPGGRHQIGTPAGFKSESVAGFLLECVAGFVGIRTAAFVVTARVQVQPDRSSSSAAPDASPAATKRERFGVRNRRLARGGGPVAPNCFSALIPQSSRTPSASLAKLSQPAFVKRRELDENHLTIMIQHVRLRIA